MLKSTLKTGVRAPLGIQVTVSVLPETRELPELLEQDHHASEETWTGLKSAVSGLASQTWVASSWHYKNTQ